jgi:phenylacetate-CoA ligase
VTLRKDSDGMAHELAATWRGYRWAGVDVGERQARFWGVPSNPKDYWRARLIDLVAHRKRLSAFSFSDAELGKYVRDLSGFKPDYFYGYVSMIRQYADYVEKTDQRGTVNPKAIVTTAEALTELDRQKIENVFGCRVFNEYGCGELGTIAHECEHGSLHLTAENMIVEILKEDGSPANPGESGEIIVTDLVNYSMPLIRYQLKDYATMSQETCPCGRKLPVVISVHGREYDMLVNSEGRKFHGEFFLYLVEDLKKQNVVIDNCQFVQKNMEITINISHKGGIRKQYFQEYFSDQLKKRFDPNAYIVVNFVSDIPREASGKLRTVIREL